MLLVLMLLLDAALPQRVGRPTHYTRRRHYAHRRLAAPARPTHGPHTGRTGPRFFKVWTTPPSRPRASARSRTSACDPHDAQKPASTRARGACEEPTAGLTYSIRRMLAKRWSRSMH